MDTSISDTAGMCDGVAAANQRTRIGIDHRMPIRGGKYAAALRLVAVFDKPGSLSGGNTVAGTNGLPRSGWQWVVRLPDGTCGTVSHLVDLDHAPHSSMRTLAATLTGDSGLLEKGHVDVGALIGKSCLIQIPPWGSRCGQPMHEAPATTRLPAGVEPVFVTDAQVWTQTSGRPMPSYAPRWMRIHAEAASWIESDEEYLSELRNRKRSSWPDPDQAGRGLCGEFEAPMNMMAWEIIALAHYWTTIHAVYSGITWQTATRWWMHLRWVAESRVVVLERELAQRIHLMCNHAEAMDNEGRRRGVLDGVSGMLNQMATVWNLAPVTGLRWNEDGWVPKFRLARAVRRAAKLIAESNSAEEYRELSHMRWRLGRGCEYRDNYREKI